MKCSLMSIYKEILGVLKINYLKIKVTPNNIARWLIVCIENKSKNINQLIRSGLKCLSLFWGDLFLRTFIKPGLKSDNDRIKKNRKRI